MKQTIAKIVKKQQFGHAWGGDLHEKSKNMNKHILCSRTIREKNFNFTTELKIPNNTHTTLYKRILEI
jgi:hypothetical protein